ncbi:MAG: cyclase [Myxococcota bacterium]|jgi:cyclase
MRRWLMVIGVVVGTVAVGLGSFIYTQLTQLEWKNVRGDVYLIQGLGGNVGVLKTSEGAIVVDTMTFPLQGERIRALAEELAGGPVIAVINTHYHRDHTHGNPSFESIPRFYATTKTKEHLLTSDTESWTGAAASTLPNELIDDTRTIQIGGKTVTLSFLGRGHTDGDLVVHFVDDRVVHLGDLFFNKRYPRIDIAGGGSAQEWAATLDRALEIEFERVIPGHGDIADAEGVRGFQRFLQDAFREVSKAKTAGLSLEQAQDTIELESDEGYGPGGLPPIVVLDFNGVVASIWDELSAQH